MSVDSRQLTEASFVPPGVTPLTSRSGVHIFLGKTQKNMPHRFLRDAANGLFYCSNCTVQHTPGVSLFCPMDPQDLGSLGRRQGSDAAKVTMDDIKQSMPGTSLLASIAQGEPSESPVRALGRKSSSSSEKKGSQAKVGPRKEAPPKVTGVSLDDMEEDEMVRSLLRMRESKNARQRKYNSNKRRMKRKDMQKAVKEEVPP